MLHASLFTYFFCFSLTALSFFQANVFFFLTQSKSKTPITRSVHCRETGNVARACRLINFWSELPKNLYCIVYFIDRQLVVKCYDIKMVKLPRGSSCRSSFMQLTTNKKKFNMIKIVRFTFLFWKIAPCRDLNLGRPSEKQMTCQCATVLPYHMIHTEYTFLQLLNRMCSLNNTILKSMTDVSYLSYKLKCKELFLKI